MQYAAPSVGQRVTNIAIPTCNTSVLHKAFDADGASSAMVPREAPFPGGSNRGHTIEIYMLWICGGLLFTRTVAAPIATIMDFVSGSVSDTLKPCPLGHLWRTHCQKDNRINERNLQDKSISICSDARGGGGTQHCLRHSLIASEPVADQAHTSLVDNFTSLAEKGILASTDPRPIFANLTLN